MEDAGLVTQGRLLFAQPAEPAKQMRVAVQLRELAHLRESSAEIAEEAASGGLILIHRAGPGGQGEGLDVAFKDLFEAGLALAHERWADPKCFRFSMARVYSRQTSCGASWT